MGNGVGDESGGSVGNGVGEDCAASGVLLAKITGVGLLIEVAVAIGFDASVSAISADKVSAAWV